MKRLVVKIGTGNLINAKTDILDQSKVLDIARQVSILASRGVEVVLVTSGAIKAGKDRMVYFGTLPQLAKKEWAGVGARHLLNLWGDAFEKHHLEVAQVWVTYASWVNRHEYESIRTSIVSYLKCGIIPLINENDVVSDKEIVLMDQGISENDRLARMVAEMIGAEGVLFLTDIGGIYDKDPRVGEGARQLRTVGRDMLPVLVASVGKSSHGTGGVGTKLNEAFACFEKGMKVSIAGLEDDVILNFASGKIVGTALAEITTV